MWTDLRVGSGFDVHAFAEEGSSLFLGGLKISHSRGLLGHSDADVLIHALVDALLGALGEGDIGQHFPPSDPQWKGASSDQFLSWTRDRVQARGFEILNVDLTLIGEEPRLSPHRDQIRQNLAELLLMEVSRLSLKATTTEAMGFLGRKEGLAAQATCLLGSRA